MDRWGFSGHLIRWHVHENAVGRLFAESAWRCGVLRQGRWYSLWHVFAGIVIENGTEIRTLLELRGQNDVSSGMIYRHVMNRSGVEMRRSYRTPGLGGVGLVFGVPLGQGLGVRGAWSEGGEMGNSE